MNIGLCTYPNKGFKNKIVLSFCLVAFLLSDPSQSQSSNLIFDHISFNEGLTTGVCQNIYQDKRGYIWFGTYSGLVRYDGYEFKVFNPIQNDSNSLSGPYVNAMAEDKRGRFWIGTNYGLSVYDRSSGKFYRFLNNPSDNSSLNNNYIRVVYYEELSDKLWIGTTNGLHSLDIKDLDITQPNNARFERYLNKPDDPASIDNNLIRDVIKDDRNRLFILTNGKYLNLFVKEKNSFEQISLGDKVNNTNKMSVVDKNNIMWISTALGYLIKCNLNTSEIQLSEPLKKISPTVYPLRRLLTIDDNLWITTEGAGLLILNTKTGEINNYASNPLNPYSLTSNNLLSILQDRSGIIWLGTNGSDINKYVPDKSKFGLYYPDGKNGLSGKVIRRTYLDKKGYIWIGTDGDGLNRFDRQTNTFFHYKNDPQNQNSLSSNKIFSIYEDHLGFLWVGTGTGGLNKFDIANQKFITYRNNPNDAHSLQDNEIRCLIEDKKNNLWVGTVLAGLAIFDRKTGYFYHYTNNPSNPNSITGNRITALSIDSNNRLFIGTSSGVDKVDLSEVDYSSYPPSLIFRHLDFVNSRYDINNIYEDSGNNIWFCSGGGGLTKWNQITGKSVTYSVKDGLPSDNLTAVLEDNQKKIWISGKNGLSKFDPITGTFKNYDTFDGLQSPEFFSGYCKTDDGELFFGGVNGFNAFYPDQIKENLHKPTVVLTDLKIYNQSVKIGEKINNHVILNQAISESKEIELSYKENYFSIEFVALDLVNAHKNMYAFKMQGLDDKWIQLGNKHEATFSNLYPKEYIFKVIASNNDGIWNEEGISLRIIVLPPWWKTNWFKIIVFIFIVLSIYIIYNLRLSSYQKKQKELTILVKKRTREITEANEQLAILNSTKDRFFSIIAHDLRNPFQAVSGFAGLLIEDYKTLPPEKIETYLNLIYKSSTSGNNLLENLLLWSRSQTGRISFIPKKLDLLAIAEETMNLLESDAQRKNIKVRVLISTNINVLADDDMLKTIFRNLVSNAIKFSHEYGTITLQSVLIDSQVEVTVADTGVGIPPENLSRLFRIDATVTTKGTARETGTGLGLILCKEFVEKHNGKIWVESVIGKGSKFKFTLPLV